VNDDKPYAGTSERCHLGTDGVSRAWVFHRCATVFYEERLAAEFAELLRTVFF
jgi:hypothetical protein